MPTIKENFEKIKRELIDTAVSCGREPEAIHLIAVSKRKPVEDIKKSIEAGAKHLGENYIQEAVEKIEAIGRQGINWHFIGHLQSNKAKLAVNYFDYIHTVDTLKLAKEIDKQAGKIQKIQKIFVQINISKEETKSGTRIENTIELVKQICVFPNLSLQGLMCMPPYFSNPEHSRPYFKQMVQIKNKIMACQKTITSMEHLSMGMSNDFKVAVEEGATMVRIGTFIFGRRD